MKLKILLLLIVPVLCFQSCKAQEAQTALPKVANYTKGELDIKITSFGENSPITIGKIMADGTIHFNWSKADLSKIDENKYMTRSIKNFYGGNFCHDANAVVTNDNATLVETQFIYLYKYDQAVATMIPSTQIDKEHNKNQLGSTINWVYSDAETTVKANCSEKKAWNGLYNFNQTTTYNLTLKKGFNLIANTVTELEKWDNGKEKGSLPKTRIIKSIDQIPSDIHWYLNYFANDELLEIKHHLINLQPITKQQYKNWLPKKLGDLKRTDYKIGKKLERIPTLNNVNLLFKKDSKTINLTIVDCVGNKNAASTFTLIKGMASRDWKDIKKTGYESASSIDDVRVMTVYNEKEAKTTLTYNANGRFLVKAEASNLKPAKLWEYLKDLNLKKLTKPF